MVKDLINERDAGDYAIGEAHPTPTAVVKKPPTTQGQNFNIPSKLEPFVLLAKNARGASAAGIIEKAIGAPGLFVFSELLECVGVKELVSNEQFAKNHQLLEIFAYGTWSEYIQRQAELPELNKAQTTKLKQLSVLSLAMTDRIIPYQVLLETLDIPSIPALEDLLIESIYSGVLTGRLDQEESRLEVIASLGRDVRPVALSPVAATTSEVMDLDRQNLIASTSQSIPSLTVALTSFLSNIAAVLNSLDIHLNAIAAKSINDLSRAKYHKELVEHGLLQVVPTTHSEPTTLKGKSKTKGIELSEELISPEDDVEGETAQKVPRGKPTAEGMEDMDLDGQAGRGGKAKKRGRA